MNISKNSWLVRPCPHGIRRLNEFQTDNIIAIGWPCIGSLAGQTREQLKAILSAPPYRLTGLALGNAYASVDIFVNQMQPGDLVLVPDGDDIYFGEITGSYHLESSVDTPTAGYSHQRTVRWLASTARKELSKELRSALKVHRTSANLSRHTAEIEALAHGRPFVPETEKTSGLIQVAYPLRPDYNITFSIPKDITRDEAGRLAAWLSTLYFVQ